MQALMYGRKADGSAEPIAIEDDGSVKVSGGAGGGGGGDASAANQLTEIARLEAIRDRFGTPVAGRAPVDTLGQPLVARQLSVSATTANQALTSTCRRISIRARGCPMRYEVGTGAQTASATTSHFIDQDERLDLSVPANANIAAIAIPAWGGSTTGTGSLAITELG